LTISAGLEARPQPHAAFHADFASEDGGDDEPVDFSTDRKR